MMRFCYLNRLTKYISFSVAGKYRWLEQVQVMLHESV